MSVDTQCNVCGDVAKEMLEAVPRPCDTQTVIMNMALCVEACCVTLYTLHCAAST